MSLDRRQVLAGTAASALAASLPAWQPSGLVESAQFFKGERVPGWVDRATHAGFFGTDVEVRVGLFDAMSLPDMLPGARAYSLGKNVMHIRAIAPMLRGECLIRYKGGAHGYRAVLGGPPGRFGPLASKIFDGGPMALRWCEDGSDLLLMAMTDGPLPPRRSVDG